MYLYNEHIIIYLGVMLGLKLNSLIRSKCMKKIEQHLYFHKLKLFLLNINDSLIIL